MSEFDTSGVVYGPQSESAPEWRLGGYVWSDLSPFAQGYVEALMVEAATLFAAMDLRSPDDEPIAAAFWRLAPETLALILRDCDDVLSLMAHNGLGMSGYAGREFWERRQAARYDVAPPLTPYLGDDGKVYLREKTDA